jgi:hypothetical protein
MMRKTTIPEPPSMPEDFVEENLPRHEPIEAMRSLIASPQEDLGKSFLEYVGTFVTTADTTRVRPNNLLDLYEINIRQVYQDAHQRPEHYDDRQHEILDHMAMGRPLTRSPTDPEKNELVLTFLRRSTSEAERRRRAQEQDRHRRRQEQEENDDIILEDGSSVSDAIESEKAQKNYEAVFEKQDFGDKVII